MSVGPGEGLAYHAEAGKRVDAGGAAVVVVSGCTRPLNELVCALISFFFSSRRRHTRCLSDWSSDVCSSDLSTVIVQNYAHRLLTVHTRTTAARQGVGAGWLVRRPVLARFSASSGCFSSQGWRQIGRASCRERV